MRHSSPAATDVDNGNAHRLPVALPADKGTVLPLPGFDQHLVAAARPFLRWAGGKTRLLQSIIPFIPPRFGAYHEPFLGAGALFFAVRSRASRGCFLSDLNQELMNAWTVVQENPSAFYRALSKYVGRDSEVEYYKVRDTEQPTAPVERAARFFYLNQTAWNGLWRVNKWGVFNVPWGARSFRGIDRAELNAVSRAIRDVTLREVDFREALDQVASGDFVYLDPPYLPVSDTSKFSGYTEKRFRLRDLEALAQLCEQLTKRKVLWVLSNRDTPAVRKLFSHARLVRLTTRRSVAAQNRRDVEPVNSPEIIVIGGER